MKFALLLLLGLAFATAACGSPLTEEAAKRQGWDNFQTAVASDRNYDIYWLGREFTAGGLTYRGPDVASFGGEVAGGGLAMTYLTPVGVQGGTVDMTITLYSQDGWTREQARRAAIVKANIESKSVIIDGKPATLV